MASRNVYVIYSGQDILALESQLAAANQHIAQLEAQLRQARCTFVGKTARKRVNSP